MSITISDFLRILIYDGEAIGGQPVKATQTTLAVLLPIFIKFSENSLIGKGAYLIMPRNKFGSISKRIVITVLVLLLWRSLNIELVTPSWQFKLSTVPSSTTEQIQNLLKTN